MLIHIPLTVGIQPRDLIKPTEAQGLVPATFLTSSSTSHPHCLSSLPSLERGYSLGQQIQRLLCLENSTLTYSQGLSLTTDTTDCVASPQYNFPDHPWDSHTHNTIFKVDNQQVHCSTIYNSQGMEAT